MESCARYLSISQDKSCINRFRYGKFKYFKFNGINIESLYIFKGKKFIRRLLFVLYKANFLKQYNSIIIYGTLPILMTITFIPFKRKILILTGLGTIFNYGLIRSVLRYILISMIKVSVRSIDKIVVLNHGDKETLQSYLPNIKLDILVVNGEGFNKEDYWPIVFRRRKFDVRDLRISYFGRLTAEKGFDKFLSIISNFNDSNILNQNSTFTVSIYGNYAGLNPSKIEGKEFFTHRKCKVNHIPHYEQKTAGILIEEQDILFMLSKNEGFPFTLMELFMTNTPVVLSNIPAHVEIISSFNNIDLGVYLINLDDVSNINIDTIHSFLKDYNLQKVRENRDILLDKFSSVKIWPQWLEIIR